MKVRKGFVSNSSSSSFVCEVCGNVESGYDAGYDDLGFAACVKGHVFCQDHIVGSLPDDHEDGYSEIPVENCPICTMTAIRDSDMLSLLLKKSDLTREQYADEIRSTFPSYSEMRDTIKVKKI